MMPVTNVDSLKRRPLRMISASSVDPPKPLFVVNGVPMGPAFQPEDIPGRYVKKVEVLTGTSAAAIGGTRAANGLILITTTRRYKPVAN
ncbi:TonB-dependent receptor plug domain-containing protein [Hymenobacter metallicola]|nr:TonB-dependent receptor plug domain-containing protein [Hymenobacter metallicola]